ncbi:MAG: hypothetical protein ACM3X1_03330 [Ignavibacteriales bacterium]
MTETAPGFFELVAQFFEQPVVLLVIGAILSGLLFPIFTNRWQIHQKGLEIRIDLGGRISRTVMGMITLIESKVLTEPFEELNKVELNKEYRKLRVDGGVIWAELESYFPNEEIDFPNKEIGKDWQKLLEELECVYKDFVATEPARGIDEKNFKDWKRKILHKKFVIMQRVLNRPMPRFSLLPGFVVRSRLYKTLKRRRLLDAGEEVLTDSVLS